MSPKVVFVLFLAGVLVLCAGLLMFGRWLSQRISKAVVWPSPPKPPSWKERALISVQLGIVLGIVAFHFLFPDNAFSKWIATPKGIGIAVLVYFGLLWIAGIVIAMLYWRRAKRGMRRVA